MEKKNIEEYDRKLENECENKDQGRWKGKKYLSIPLLFPLLHSRGPGSLMGYTLCIAQL